MRRKNWMGRAAVLVAFAAGLSGLVSSPARAENDAKPEKAGNVEKSAAIEKRVVEDRSGTLANKPWKDKTRAIVLDAYEKNPINWAEVVKNKQIRAFIGKSSDGLPSPYSCPGNETEKTLCKKTFQNYFMKQRLYHTRRALAKNLGLKWGAYHLGRPGNPIAQADHFLNFAEPEPDELIALDIEHDDPGKWISFADAEIFARRIHEKIGRYPVLYTNHHTATRIAAQRKKYPLLARLPLWYARYRPEIEGVFPMGNWERYDLWQFSSGLNCGDKECLYRVNGAPDNIDVNVSPLSVAEFEKAWPFNGLVPVRDGADSEKPVQIAKAEPKPAAIPVKRETPGSELSVADLKQLGVAAVPVPQRSPRAKDQEFDVVDLVVRVKKRKHSSKTGPKTNSRLAALAGEKEQLVD